MLQGEAGGRETGGGACAGSRAVKLYACSAHWPSILTTFRSLYRVVGRAS